MGSGEGKRSQSASRATASRPVNPVHPVYPCSLGRLPDQPDRVLVADRPRRKTERDPFVFVSIRVHSWFAFINVPLFLSRMIRPVVGERARNFAELLRVLQRVVVADPSGFQSRIDGTRPVRPLQRLIAAPPDEMDAGRSASPAQSEQPPRRSADPKNLSERRAYFKGGWRKYWRSVAETSRSCADALVALGRSSCVSVNDSFLPRAGSSRSPSRMTLSADNEGRRRPPTASAFAIRLGFCDSPSRGE